MNKNNQKFVKNKNVFASMQKGSSLIEVLVTVSIMAVGLLGLALMQLNSLKNVNNSQFRSLATIYAYDMAERMRSNPSGDYNGLDTATASVTEKSCSSACSVSDMVEYDGYKWAEQIRQNVISGGLPTGSGTVIQTVSGPVSGARGTFVIKVQWDEQGRDSNGGKVDTADFTLTVQL